ncbi:DNA gyrase inhibitor YacG [bacterium]|nr:DNA gyrase inhibitor YacG [bacterium]
MDVKCPHCQKMTRYEENSFRPFCSERCKLIDLGDWASEKFRIKGDPIIDEETKDIQNLNTIKK